MPSILLVTQDLYRAGAQRQCVELALGLSQLQAWRVEVVALEPDGPFASDLRAAGITLHACPRRWRWDLSPIRGIASVARRGEHDLIHSFLFLPNFYVRLSRLLWRRPAIVSSLRSSGVAGLPRYVAEVLMAPLCDLIIANSESGRRALTARGVSPDRVVVVPNGLDLTRFSPAKGKKCRDGGAGPRLGMVARMEVDKDHEGLIEAMPLVLSRHPRVRLVLAGDGSLRSRVEKRIMVAGLREAVELLGTVERPEAIYPTFDIYVQPSTIAEGTSNSILEAMASGLPVVATDSGGNSEIIMTGETGLLVPPRDPPALAAAINSLLDDPDAAARMGANGAARVASYYSREAMVAATAGVFESVLNRRDCSGR